tara:strand:- start:180 stop:1298 length:1119 start_codon:yes stop_codon:yes gene_type:complete
MKKYLLILSGLAINVSVCAQFTSDMNFLSSEDESINPSSVLENGQYIYLDFFSTTCGACNSVAPEINNAYNHYGQNNQNVFFIGVDNFSSASACQSFSASHESDFPVVAGQEGGGTIFSLFEQTGYPKGILIAPSGEIVTTLSYPSIVNLTESLQNFVSPSSECDLIEITSVSLNTQTNLIEVEVDTNSPYLYGYPSFLILNNIGDTLAVEQVNYYGLGGESTHYLGLETSFNLWDSDLELQLYSGFSETMECTFTLSLNSIENKGCTDSDAGNYNYNALVDNGSCLYDLDYFDVFIDLDAGWNLVGYSCNEPIASQTAFSPYTDNVIIVKDYLGAAYLPEYGFNGIGNLERGFGYQLKINQSIENFNLCNP